MRRGLSSGQMRWRSVFSRIDQTAKWLNPLLAVAAALLALIDLSVYSALEISRRYPPRPAAGQPAGAPAVAPDRPVVSPPTQG
jgi:hypothetical protein